MIVLIMALLNRARGDDRWMPDWLPGRALWYITLLVAGAAIVQTGSVAAGAIWALGYLLWAIPSWGHLIGMGRFMPDRSPGWFEAMLLGWSRGRIPLAFWARNLLALPAFAGIAVASDTAWFALFAFPFAALIVGAYEAAWRLRPDNPIWLAEALTGALWGLAILTI